MKKPVLLLAILLVSYLTTLKAQDTVAILARIQIIDASDTEDSLGVKTIREAINSADGEKAFDMFCILGPRLWDKCKQDEKLKKIEKGNVDFKVPVFENGKQSGMGTIKGKMIQSRDDFNNLWQMISADMKGADILTIHAKDFTTRDKFHHWLLFANKMEEPIFILQANGKRYLFKTVKNAKLFFIEEMTF